MREGKTVFGGIKMQEAKWTMPRKNTGALARVTVGIILFVLLIGLWACLWVPPSIF
jgi:hypothetical protein